MRGLHGWFGPFGTVLITVAALPLAVVAAWLLARHRRACGSTRASAWRGSLTEVGIVYGTLPGVWLTMAPVSWTGAVPGPPHSVPLWDLVTVLEIAPLTALVQIVGNLLVFAPLGFLAPLRFPALASIPRIMALTAGCAVLIDTARYVLRLELFVPQLGQVSTVDEVLLNVAGAGLAALASRRWWRYRALPTRTSA